MLEGVFGWVDGRSGKSHLMESVVVDGGEARGQYGGYNTVEVRMDGGPVD